MYGPGMTMFYYYYYFFALRKSKFWGNKTKTKYALCVKNKIVMNAFH